MMSAKMVANFLLFQVGWLVAVFGAAWGYPLAGLAYAAAFVVLHHWGMGRERTPELAFVLSAAAFGYLLDSALVLTGFISFPAHTQVGFPTTVWMVCLWIMFSMTLRYSLGWLRGRWVLSGALGLVFGPVAYWAGSKIGAIELHAGLAGLAAVGVAWGASMLVLLGLEILTRQVGGLDRRRAGGSAGL